MTLRERIELAPLTSLGVGGAARFLVDADSVADIRDAHALAQEKDLPLRILGGGTNVLVPDEGVEAVVMRLSMRDVSFVEDGEHVLAVAEAGASWDAFVGEACKRGLWGIENLSGIPGTVGGAVVGNIGAYGAAVSDTLAWAEVCERAANEVTRFAREACALDYRRSAFTGERARVLLRAAFVLSRSGAPNLGYRDLAARFSGRIPALHEVREAIFVIRKEKFPDLSREGSAGSFFKNIIVGEAAALALRKRYPEIPLFPLPETAGVKVPVAWLLDHVLHLNGYTQGPVRLFERQPLVLVAAHGATHRDVEALAQEVEARVRDECGITLEREVGSFA